MPIQHRALQVLMFTQLPAVAILTLHPVMATRPRDPAIHIQVQVHLIPILHPAVVATPTRLPAESMATRPRDPATLIQHRQLIIIRHPAQALITTQLLQATLIHPRPRQGIALLISRLIMEHLPMELLHIRLHLTAHRAMEHLAMKHLPTAHRAMEHPIIKLHQSKESQLLGIFSRRFLIPLIPSLAEDNSSLYYLR